jgi:predicted metal-dependent peptidase
MGNSFFDELFQKLRINFLFNHPFLSVLALSIETNFVPNAKSAFETNGFKIDIDLKKLKNYSDDEITYLYAHTLLHIVLKHPYRQKTRDSYIWNQACDVVINNILADFKNVGQMPNDELFDEDLRDKCVEEVYEVLYKEEEENSNSGESEDKEDEVKVTPDEKGDLEAHKYDESKLDLQEVEDENTSSGEREKIDGIIIQALSIAKKSSSLCRALAIEIDTLIKPEINLQDALKEFLISSLFEKRTTYSRPNRRFIHSGLYLPGNQKSDEFLDLYIALDSSSSVTLDEYKKFLGVVADVCEGFYEYSIKVLPFDVKVKEEYIVDFNSFSSTDKNDFFIPKSDGGTNFDEVLRYLKQTDVRSENLLMVLSDGEFDISESLVCKTIFIINDKKNLTKFEYIGRVMEFTL